MNQKGLRTQNKNTVTIWIFSIILVCISKSTVYNKPDDPMRAQLSKFPCP